MKSKWIRAVDPWYHTFCILRQYFKLPEWEEGNRSNDLCNYLEDFYSVGKRQQLKTWRLTMLERHHQQMAPLWFRFQRQNYSIWRAKLGGSDIWLAHENLVSYLKNHFSNFATSNPTCCQHFPSAKWHLICIIISRNVWNITLKDRRFGI